MKFHIEKIILWFSEREKKVITFENNKVNVIRGNSSRGKSNLFAIIDYCLMSDKPNIVEPVINENTEYYGLEFMLNGQYYAISRKKPKDGIGADSVYLAEEPFSADYYPSNTNRQVSDARTFFDQKFGIKDDSYKYPYGFTGTDSFVVSFRSFLMYNALTENIISDQYEYFNYKFFEDYYVDKDYKRSYLLDALLGIDNVEESKQKKIIEDLKHNQNSSKRQTTKYNDTVQAFLEKLKETKTMIYDANLAETKEFNGLESSEQIQKIQEIIEKNEPHTVEEVQNSNKRRDELTKTLYRKQLQLNNIKRAKREYEKYWSQVGEIEDSLKPVEYIREHIDELGVTAWSRQILDALQMSLTDIKKSHNGALPAFVRDQQIKNLESDIKTLEEEIKKEEKINITPIQNSARYFVLGRLRELVMTLKQLRSAIPTEKPNKLDEVGDGQKRKHAEKIIKAIEDRRATVIKAELDPAIQHYFDQFTTLENFVGSKTRYNRDQERLEIGRNAILSYTNVGSQSNYMFLHLCFFLGLHRFLFSNPSQHVGQFLFIDQPSIPYYESSDNNKSTDRLKLMEAFRVINSFMKEVADDNEEFQILLIEHAEESYWTGENKLDYFVTKESFEGENALVPLQVIRKKQNEAKD